MAAPVVAIEEASVSKANATMTVRKANELLSIIDIHDVCAFDPREVLGAHPDRPGHPLWDQGPGATAQNLPGPSLAMVRGGECVV